MIEDKDEIQRAWDVALITAARYEAHMLIAVKEFLRNIKADGFVLDDASSWLDADFEKARTLLVRLELKRCLDRDRDGELEFRGFYFNALPFIGEHSQDLVSCITNKNNDPNFLMDNISNYRWIRRSYKSASKRKHDNRLARNRNAYRQTKTIHARELDKRSSWGTVK